MCRFRRRLTGVGAVAITLLGAGIAAAEAPAATAASTATSAAERLPGPPTTTESWTARVLYPVAARRAPGGRIVMSLRHYTPFSQGPGVYMVTGAKVIGRKTWIRIQLPKRPNGTQGWVPEAAVDVRRNVTWIRVKTSTRTVQVFRKGVRIKAFRAAVGTGGTPTPRGLFAIWDPVPTGGQLGPYILVLTAHSNVLRTFAGGDGIVGIHGWPSSGVLGQAVSHGCVRMSRDGVRDLQRYALPGVPVEIVA
jgi:lipoprotein-anchoring transpeptidase ErfK/SrfK